MSEEELPYSPACENNKAPILEILAPALAGCNRVLEIGAGTGQHATWFAAHLPALHWLPTEHPSALPQLLPRCSRYEGSNLAAPVALDVETDPWPIAVPDAVFTANTLHIMPAPVVGALFAGLGRATGSCRLAIYGPFNYGGRYSAESNARFDSFLRARSSGSAIRDFEWVDGLARAAGFELEADHPMPANNQLLLWAR